MWILYATGSAFFAGITSILAKCGIKKTDSDVATAIRTIVVLLFSWLMVLVAGSGSGIGEIDGKTMLFLLYCQVLQQGHRGCVIFVRYRLGMSIRLLR